MVRGGDGKVATVRPDDSVAVWTVAPQEWSVRLCTLVGNLAPAERAAYLIDVDTDPACSG